MERCDSCWSATGGWASWSRRWRPNIWRSIAGVVTSSECRAPRCATDDFGPVDVAIDFTLADAVPRTCRSWPRAASTS